MSDTSNHFSNFSLWKCVLLCKYSIVTFFPVQTYGIASLLINAYTVIFYTPPLCVYPIIPVHSQFLKAIQRVLQVLNDVACQHIGERPIIQICQEFILDPEDIQVCLFRVRNTSRIVMTEPLILLLTESNY